MHVIVDGFERIGARARVRQAPEGGDLLIDVGRDRRGEFFDLRVPSGRDLGLLDVRPRERHLVLMARPEKHRFLCGHDERAWFVAALPVTPPVTTVAQARDALKPGQALRGEHRLARKHRNRRRNPAYVRQGEWFFVPAPALEVEDWVILRREPLSRGRGTPHVAEEAVRLEGETVWVCPRVPQGLDPDEYRRLIERSADVRGWGWRPMTRNPVVYVRGRMTHPEHRTVVFRGWHRVLMNRESEAPPPARSRVIFLD